MSSLRVQICRYLHRAALLVTSICSKSKQNLTKHYSSKNDITSFENVIFLKVYRS
jgi:hypothetical protein